MIPRAQPTIYEGRTYHSKAESEHAQYLDLLKHNKEIKKWVPQFKMEFKMNGLHICYHYMDFLVTHRDGSKELVEIKGLQTPVWKLKRNMVYAWLKKNKKYRYTIIKV